jgi:hypothetical protein
VGLERYVGVEPRVALAPTSLEIRDEHHDVVKILLMYLSTTISCSKNWLGWVAARKSPETEHECGFDETKEK